MTKNLTTLLLALLVLGGCSMEQDTRMLCDCDYIFVIDTRLPCNSDIDGSKNIPLITNISEKKFHFNGIHYSNSAPQGNLDFQDDVIYYSLLTENINLNGRFDRVSLVLRWQDFNRTAFYNCRTVKGI